MKFRSNAAFDRDFARLPHEHRAQFQTAVHDHFLPAIAAGAFTGSSPWPRRLRIHRRTDSAIYSLTWSFTGPHGRATLHLDTTPEGTEPVLVCRRIGDHSIYHHP